MAEMEEPPQIESNPGEQSSNGREEQCIWSRITSIEEKLTFLRGSQLLAPAKFSRMIDDIEEQIREIKQENRVDSLVMKDVCGVVQELSQERENNLLAKKRRKRNAVKMYEANVLATAADILVEKQYWLYTSGLDAGRLYAGQIPVDIGEILDREELTNNFGLTFEHERVLVQWMMSKEQSARNEHYNETQAQFAELLCEEHLDDAYFKFWDPLFRFCYNKSIEELIDNTEEMRSFLDRLIRTSEE